jgi:Protein of unknown function (DUF3309)
MSTIVVVILVLPLIGALPTWPYSRGWGYYPKWRTRPDCHDPIGARFDWACLRAGKPPTRGVAFTRADTQVESPLTNPVLLFLYCIFSWHPPKFSRCGAPFWRTPS